MSLARYQIFGRTSAGVEFTTGFHIEWGHDILAGHDAPFHDALGQTDEKFLEAFRHIIHSGDVIERTRLIETVAPGSHDVPQGAETVWGVEGLYLGGTGLPASLGAVLRLRSGRPVRGGVNWMFLPPFRNVSELKADGTIDPTGSYGLAVSTLLSKMDDTWDVGSETSVPATNGSTRVKIVSQRRRALGLSEWKWDCTGADLDYTLHQLRSRRS